MSLVCFGQPEGGIIQTAYVVKDIQQAMQEWITKLKVGPWFLLKHFTGEDALYRGKPTDVDVSIAMSFAGHMMIELIEQHNDVPSVYREISENRGYGFHHWGIATADFERDVERYRASGCDLAFYERVPSGGRVGYMDTTSYLPGMAELIELGASFDATFSRMYGATLAWDGRNPVRSFL
ncbi:MAG TPA: VOC family protein [Candidatus Binataceae bacterium]|nr:VOC family protein [Candidatus Binataceae bacterium]